MVVGPLIAQEEAPTFREDQIYLSIAYPYFSDAPNTLIQNKLSYAFSFGFVRDMPINKQRSLAVGIGLGYDQATIYNNNLFTYAGNNISATVIEGGYQQNYLRMLFYTLEQLYYFRYVEWVFQLQLKEAQKT